MKYLYWLLVLLTVILRRLVFPLIYLAVPIRGYLRNRVYNYSLQNNIKIKRLQERNPQLNEDKTKYLLNGGTHSSETGIIEYKNVSTIEYYFVLCLWLLLDDDANQDTYDAGFNRTIINKERKAWMPKFIIDSLVKDSTDNSIIGNSFDLGDVRSKEPLYGFWSVFWWTLRNPAYNFNYKFNQMVGNKYYFQIIFKDRIYGWKFDGKLDNENTYSWELGKKI